MSKSGKKDKGKKKQNQEQKTETVELENTGNYLRTLRLGKGLNLRDVSRETRISIKNLQAIEDQDFSSLPADTFTRGLLKIYANFLGADPETVTTRFMEERREHPVQKKRSKTVRPQKKLLKPKHLAEPTHVSSVTMAVILLVIIVVSFTGFSIYTSWNPFSSFFNGTDDLQSALETVFPVEESAQLPSADQSSSAPASEQHQADEASQESQESLRQASMAADNQGGLLLASQEEPITIKMHFLKDTRLELTKESGETSEKKFLTGETKTWTGGSSFLFRFDRPESAEISVNGKPVSFPDHQENGAYTLHIPPDSATRQPDE